MSLENALNFAKTANEEKMGYRFQFPISMKNEFESICEKNGVSMTDMILGLISSAIDESKGLSDSTTLSIVNKIEELEDKLDNDIKLFNKVEEDVITDVNGDDYYLTDNIQAYQLKISALKAELKKRNK